MLILAVLHIFWSATMGFFAIFFNLFVSITIADVIIWLVFGVSYFWHKFYFSIPSLSSSAPIRSIMICREFTIVHDFPSLLLFIPLILESVHFLFLIMFNAFVLIRQFSSHSEFVQLSLYQVKLPHKASAQGLSTTYFPLF